MNRISETFLLCCADEEEHVMRMHQCKVANGALSIERDKTLKPHVNVVNCSSFYIFCLHFFKSHFLSPYSSSSSSSSLPCINRAFSISASVVLTGNPTTLS